MGINSVKLANILLIAVLLILVGSIAYSNRDKFSKSADAKTPAPAPAQGA